MSAFEKVLSKNDTGESGSHQAGILVPKGDRALLEFFPCLDTSVKNPDAIIQCIDEDGRNWRFRFIYYNNRHHDPAGTRDEYRITRMTGYLRTAGAISGQSVIFESIGPSTYRIMVTRCVVGDLAVTKLAGWRRVH